MRLELLQGMARATLLSLEHKGDAGGSDGGADLVCLVADDAEDLVGGGDSLGGGNDVQKEGLASDFVEDFGATGFEARTFAGRHDGDSEG